MEAVSITWFHRKHGISPEFSDFRSIQLAPQTQSPADMDVSWLIYCCCSGYAFSCKNQCHPFCNCKSKSFCTSSASSCTCDSKTSEISSYVNRSDLFKCCCFQQLSQYATAEPLGKFGWCNYSSVCKQFCVESSSSTKCGGCQYAFNDGCLVSNGKIWFLVIAHDYYHKIFCEVCGSRLFGLARKPQSPGKHVRSPLFLFNHVQDI